MTCTKPAWPSSSRWISFINIIQERIKKVLLVTYWGSASRVDIETLSSSMFNFFLRGPYTINIIAVTILPSPNNFFSFSRTWIIADFYITYKLPWLWGWKTLLFLKRSVFNYKSIYKEQIPKNYRLIICQLFISNNIVIYMYTNEVFYYEFDITRSLTLILVFWRGKLSFLPLLSSPPFTTVFLKYSRSSITK